MSEQLLQQILNELKDIRSDVNSMKSDMNSMKSDMSSMKSDMSSMQSDMNSMKSEMSSMKSEINSIKSEQELIKLQLKENTDLIRALYDRQEETDAKLEALTIDVHHLRGDVTRIEEKQNSHHAEIMDELSDIKKDVDFTYQKTAINEKELYKLKNI